MTVAGWIIMLSSIGFVVGLLAFCFYRVLSQPEAPDPGDAPLDSDTKDRHLQRCVACPHGLSQ